MGCCSLAGTKIKVRIDGVYSYKVIHSFYDKIRMLVLGVAVILKSSVTSP